MISENINELSDWEKQGCTKSTMINKNLFTTCTPGLYKESFT